MGNREILLVRLRQLPFVKSAALNPLPADKLSLHTSPALELTCKFSDFEGGARGVIYAPELLLDDMNSHDSIVENITKLFDQFPPGS